MDAKKAVTVALAILGIAFALWRFSSAKSVQDEIGEKPTYWLCTDPACAHEYTLSARDAVEAIREHGANDGKWQCPKCEKKTVVQAVPCPKCGRFAEPYARGIFPPVCPHCKQRIHNIIHEEHTPAEQPTPAR